MLDRMATLVSSDAQSGGGVTVKVLSRENEPAMHWVVVIAEETILLHDLHIANSSRVEDTSGGLSSGKTRGGGNLAPLCVGDLYFCGSP